jgi:hypothetical protein
MQTHTTIAATSKLIDEITATAVIHGMPSEAAHNASTIINPNHAVTTRIAAATPQATIHASVSPARRVSSVNKSRKSEMTRRTDVNVPDNSSRMLWGGDVSSEAALLPDEASPAGVTLPGRGSAASSDRLSDLSNARSG